MVERDMNKIRPVSYADLILFPHFDSVVTKLMTKEEREEKTIEQDPFKMRLSWAYFLIPSTLIMDDKISMSCTADVIWEQDGIQKILLSRQAIVQLPTTTNQNVVWFCSNAKDQQRRVYNGPYPAILEAVVHDIHTFFIKEREKTRKQLLSAIQVSNEVFARL